MLPGAQLMLVSLLRLSVCATSRPSGKYCCRYHIRDTDLRQDFLEILRPDIDPNTTYEALYIGDGPQDPQGYNFSGLEADLDVEYTVCTRIGSL